MTIMSGNKCYKKKQEENVRESVLFKIHFLSRDLNEGRKSS